MKSKQVPSPGNIFLNQLMYKLIIRMNFPYQTEVKKRKTNVCLYVENVFE